MDAPRTAGAISRWRDDFLAAGREGLKARPAPPEERELREAQRKIGEQAIEIDTLRALLEKKRAPRSQRRLNRPGFVGGGSLAVRCQCVACRNDRSPQGRNRRELCHVPATNQATKQAMEPAGLEPATSRMQTGRSSS